jgi:hypothetical protein
MRRSILLILLISAVVHVTFLALTHARLQPHYFSSAASIEENTLSTISSDASHYYGRYADRILQTGAYETASGPITSHMPGTSALLALSKLLTGHLGFYAVFQLVALFTAVYYVCCRTVTTYSESVVALSAIFFLLHPILIYQSWTVNSDVLFISACLPSISLLTQPELDMRRAVQAAMWLGIATYFREIGLILAICVALSLIRFERSRLRLGLGFFAVFMTVLSPWIIRNYLSTGEFILATSKGARIFFMSSQGITPDILNPLDAGKGGEIDYEALKSRASDYLEDHGIEPGQHVPDSFYLWHGVKNYLSRPGLQARSLLLKAVNLLRPSVARRHLERVIPGWLSITVYWLLAAQHAALLWIGLVILYGRRRAREGPLRWMVAGSVVISLVVWAEPRYLLPFYLPIFIVALDFYISSIRSHRVSSSTPHTS